MPSEEDREPVEEARGCSDLSAAHEGFQLVDGGDYESPCWLFLFVFVVFC